MKRFFIFSGLAFFALPVFAATIIFTPSEVSVVAGEQISIVISVDAGDEKIVTVKAALAYPADVLEPVSFSFASNSIQLSQPGYDQMKDGVVLKTAGFPGGFTGTREFGTLVLMAKQTGAAIVSVSDESLLLNAQSANRFAGARSLAVTIAAPVPAAPLIEKTQEAKLVPEIGAAGASSAEEAASSTATTSEQSAAVGGLDNQPIRPVLILTILVIAALGGLVWRMYKNNKNGSRW